MFSKQSLKIHFLPFPTSSSSSVLSGLSSSRPHHLMWLCKLWKRRMIVSGEIGLTQKNCPLESVMVSPPMSPADPSTPLEQRTSMLFHPASTDRKEWECKIRSPKHLRL